MADLGSASEQFHGVLWPLEAASSMANAEESGRLNELIEWLVSVPFAFVENVREA